MKFNKKMIIGCVVTAVCVSVGVSSITRIKAATTEKTLFDGISTNMDYSQENADVMSSNPYDYIKYSEEYKNLITLGKEALPQLKNILETQDGDLNSYMIALAMEEIAGVNIYEETNVDWSTSKEFLNAWNVYEKKITVNQDDTRIKKSAPTKNNTVNEDIVVLPYRFSNFYKRIICRDCEKARFDENFKDSFGNKRQYGIKFCNYHINNTALEAEFVDYGYTDYNCLAYALGETGPCNWMWPSSWSDKPSVECVNDYFVGEGYTTEAYSEEKQDIYKEKKAIYVYGVKEKESNEYYVVHFARTDLIDGSDIGEYAQVSKWGMGGIYKIKNVNGYRKKWLW